MGKEGDARIKKIIYCALPLLAFVALSALFHYRAFTEGMLIAPDNDALRLNYPLKHLYAYALKDLEFPLWNPYAFAGMPFLAEMHVGALYPLNILFYLALPAPYAYNLSYIVHFAMAGFFTYMYLRLVGLRALPSFAGGVVFGFSGFLIANKDHTAIVNSSAYLPLVVYFLERLRRKPGFASSLPLALAAAVQIFAGNMQVCVYTYFVAGVYLLFYTARALARREGGGLRLFLWGAFGFLLGFVIALPQILATVELSGLSWMGHSKVYRGYEYFSLYHVYLATLPSLISPHLFSGWGPRDGVVFLIGSVPLVFAAVALFAGLERGRFDVFFWGMVAAAGLVLALGSDTPLNMLMYRVPFYNEFRAHGRNLFEVTMAVAALFAFGLDSLMGGGVGGRRFAGRAALLLGAVMVSSVALAVAIQYMPLGGLVERLARAGFERPDLIREKVSLTSQPVYSSLLFMAAYLSLLLFFTRTGRRRLVYLIAVLVALEVFFISSFGTIGGPKMDDADDLCKSEPYGLLAGEEKAPLRVATVVRTDSSIRANPSSNLTCGVGSIDSYDPFVLDDYATLLDLWLSGYYTHRWPDIMWNNTVLGMLGVKYIKATKDADFDLQLMRAEGGKTVAKKVPITGWRVYEGQELEGGAMLLGKDGLALSTPFTLQAGTYVISAMVRAPGRAEGRLAATLSGAASQSRLEVLHIIPDRIGPDIAEFHQVFRGGGYDLYMLELASFSEVPVEVSNVRLEKLDNYSPFPLSDEATGAASPYSRVAEDETSYLYLNNNRLPRAWSVKRLVQGGGIEDIKKKLFALEVNPAEEAILSADDIRRIGRAEFLEGEVEVERLGMNSVLLRTRFPGPGFVVLADQFYPGWRARVDGAEAEIYKTNGVLRGIVVPSGEHRVAFIYRPGWLIALIGLSALLSVLAVAVLIWRRNEQV